METNSAKPPDGGWGWIVVFSAFIVNIIIDGCSYSFGVLLPSLLDEFKESRSKTTWIGSVLNSVPLLCGPIASYVSNRTGCRISTVIGGLIVAAGFISSSFVQSVNSMIVTYGLIAGFGFSFPYLNSIVVVTLYFKKKRALATGIAECGAGIGTLIMAPLYEYLIHKYNWRIAVVIFGVISLTILICGCVFRPIPNDKQSSMIHENHKSRKNTHQEIELSVIQVTENEEEQCTSSTCTVPKNKPTCVIDAMIFRNKFFPVMLLSTVTLYFWYDVPYVFTVDRGIQLEISEKKSALIVSIMGITHTAGNLLFGFLGDLKKIYRSCLYGIGLFLAGTVLSVVPFVIEYIPNAVLGGLYGLLSAAPEALTAVLVADILGDEKLNNAMGVVMFCQGVANIVGLPVAGWLYEISGNYDITFYSAGICIAISGLVVIICRQCSCKASRKYTFKLQEKLSMKICHVKSVTLMSVSVSSHNESS